MLGKPKDEEPAPEIVQKAYPSLQDTKKVKKKIRCLVLDTAKGNMPRLVYKPVNVSYGKKWFKAGGEKYWIVYSLIKDFGKYYIYMTQQGNAVGGLSFSEHEEFADANQVELMTTQHAVEVFKKNKGISQTLVIIIALVAMGAIIGLIISVTLIGGMNAQIATLKAQTTAKDKEIEGYKVQLGIIPPPAPAPTPTNGGKH